MSDAHTIIKSIFIAAPREAVWAYLTEADKLGKWYHRGEADLSEGAPYRLLSSGEDGKDSALVWGEVREWSPPSKLVTTFTIGPIGDAETLVTWTLSSVQGGTRLLLTHEGIANAAGDAPLGLIKALDTGWDKHLSGLRASADT